MASTNRSLTYSVSSASFMNKSMLKLLFFFYAVNESRYGSFDLLPETRYSNICYLDISGEATIISTSLGAHTDEMFSFPIECSWLLMFLYDADRRRITFSFFKAVFSILLITVYIFMFRSRVERDASCMKLRHSVGSISLWSFDFFFTVLDYLSILWLGFRFKKSKVWPVWFKYLLVVRWIEGKGGRLNLCLASPSLATVISDFVGEWLIIC